MLICVTTYTLASTEVASRVLWRHYGQGQGREADLRDPYFPSKSAEWSSPAGYTGKGIRTDHSGCCCGHVWAGQKCSLVSSTTELPHSVCGQARCSNYVLGGAGSARRRSHGLHPGSDAVSCAYINWRLPTLKSMLGILELGAEMDHTHFIHRHTL